MAGNPNPDTSGLIPNRGQGVPGAGRKPNEFSVTYWAKQLLEANGGEEANEVAKSMIANAKGGNSSLLKELLDRVEGPVKQQIDLNWPTEKLLEVLGKE